MSIYPMMEQIRECEQFDERPVDAELVQTLLEEAVWAPNHHLREPWRFIWVAKDYRGKLEETLDLSTQSEIRAQIRQAPVCLIVAAPMPQDAREAKDDFSAACCLIQNLQILASASGLGMNWYLPLQQEGEIFCSAAGLQANERIAGVLGLGYFRGDNIKESDNTSVRIDIR